MRRVKKLLFIFALFISVSFAAEAIDAEIIKNLDFYENMEVVQHLDMATHLRSDGSLDVPTPQKSSGEKTNEPH